MWRRFKQPEDISRTNALKTVPCKRTAASLALAAVCTFPICFPFLQQSVPQLSGPPTRLSNGPRQSDNSAVCTHTLLTTSQRIIDFEVLHSSYSFNAYRTIPYSCNPSFLHSRPSKHFQLLRFLIQFSHPCTLRIHYTRVATLLSVSLLTNTHYSRTYYSRLISCPDRLSHNYQSTTSLSS